MCSDATSCDRWQMEVRPDLETGQMLLALHSDRLRPFMSRRVSDAILTVGRANSTF